MPECSTPECWTIDPLVTPYVDGALPSADREEVERHLRACAPCRARIAAEQAVHGLLRTRTAALCTGRAPEALRARCADAARVAADAAPARQRPAWPARLAPLAAAAALVLIVGGAFVYQLTSASTRVLAAELAADHVKCALVNAALGTGQSAQAVERSLDEKFAWRARLPENPGDAGLELVGARTCLYGEGRIAHIMYRHEGRPVSVFMLPADVRREQVVNTLGHQAAIWSVGDRTFVLVGRGPRTSIDRVTSFVRAGLR